MIATALGAAAGMPLPGHSAHMPQIEEMALFNQTLDAFISPQAQAAAG